MSDVQNKQDQPEHPSQAEGERDIGGPGAETANTDAQSGNDPARSHPSQAEGDRNASPDQPEQA